MISVYYGPLWSGLKKLNYQASNWTLQVKKSSIEDQFSLCIALLVHDIHTKLVKNSVSKVPDPKAHILFAYSLHELNATKISQNRLDVST
jgi:hypothetical protein